MWLVLMKLEGTADFMTIKYDAEFRERTCKHIGLLRVSGHGRCADAFGNPRCAPGLLDTLGGVGSIWLKP
jgi:hypothetical protein